MRLRPLCRIPIVTCRTHSHAPATNQIGPGLYMRSWPSAGSFGASIQMPRTSQGGPEIIWWSPERMKDLFSARRRQYICCPMKIPFMLPPGSVQCPKKTGRHDQLKWYMDRFGLEHSQQSRIQNHWQREHWLAVRPLCSPCQWFLFLKLAWLC